MNRKITITFAIVAVIAAGVSGVSMYLSDNSLTTYQNTDPIHFTNENFDERIKAQYITIDPMEVKRFSGTVVTGTIQNIKTELVLVAIPDPIMVDEDGNPDTDYIPVTEYTILVDETIKGDIQKLISLKTDIPSKVGFQTGDNVLVMALEQDNHFVPMSGPHGMYKIIGDELIGTEFTLPSSILTE